MSKKTELDEFELLERAIDEATAELEATSTEDAAELRVGLELAAELMLDTLAGALEENALTAAEDARLLDDTVVLDETVALDDGVLLLPSEPPEPPQAERATHSKLV